MTSIRNMKVQRICPTCRHPNIVESNSQSVNAYFTCRCGAVLPVGESQRDFQNKTNQNVVSSKGAAVAKKTELENRKANSPDAAFEHYVYCVSFVNEIGRLHGANSREMDEVWPVMIQALGYAVGAFKALEFSGKIAPGSDLAKKYIFLMNESEKLLNR
jgi:hypothetical protein